VVDKIVSGPVSETPPLKFTVLLKLATPLKVAVPEALSVVNAPVEGFDAPIGVLLIDPPVIVAPEEAKVFAMVEPFKETAPVPVENDPLPVCAKFPVVVMPVTPVNAPPVETLSPVEVKAKVPVEFPMAIVEPAVLAKFAFPV
jgi:hypothetical protein